MQFYLRPVSNYSLVTPSLSRDLMAALAVCRVWRYLGESPHFWQGYQALDKVLISGDTWFSLSSSHSQVHPVHVERLLKLPRWGGGLTFEKFPGYSFICRYVSL